MTAYRVSKVDAVAMLDATKVTLEEIGRVRMDQSQRGAASSSDKPLVTAYAEIRRLREFVQRCIAAYHEQVELDLGTQDAPYLVACFRRCAELIELRLASTTDVREREWMTQKRDALMKHAMELATHPLLELPLPRVGPLHSPVMRAFHTQLQNKVARSRMVEAASVAPAAAQPQFGNTVNLGDVQREFGTVYRGPTRQGGVEYGAIPAVTAGGSAPGLGRSQMAGAPVPSTEAPMHRPFETQKVHDARLRSLLGLDIRAFERALGASDYRMAAVHLASVLEAYVLDAALPRAAELGLPAGPEAWNPQDVLIRVLGERCTPQDRAMSFLVFTARNLIRPATQMFTPFVVTAQSLQQELVFVQQVLQTLGYQAAE